jgi:predicted permease
MRFLEARHAFRSLRRTPVFTIAIVLTIALGIGANIAAYNVVYSVLLRPLPFRDPGRLVQLWETTPALPQLQVAAPDFEDWRQQTRHFQAISAYTFQGMNRITMISPGEPEVMQATMATHDLFPTLGVHPLLGRDFTIEDEQQKQNVALISEKLWRRKFGADHAIAGKSLRLETQVFTVIGVVSTENAFPAWADVWLPFSLLESELQNRRKYHAIEVIARLKPGVSESEAQAEIQTINARSAASFPETNKNVGAYLVPLSRQLTEEVRPALLLVWAAVALVLLIACANVAHLMMGRMLERGREAAIRLALGASRMRLVELVLSESLLLIIMGSAGGTILASWLTEFLRRIAAGGILRIEWAAMPGPVWLFAGAVSLGFGLLFALPSCWQVLMFRLPNLGGTIDGRAATRRRSRLSSVLLVAELALAFVVVAGAGLLLRSFVLLMNEEPGFTSRNILALEIPSKRDWNKAHEFFDSELIPAIRALPGVVGVAAANSAPMSLGPTEHSRFATRFAVAGMTVPQGQYPVANIRAVTPEYFHVLQIPLKQGRWLTEDDRGKPRVLINEALARLFFPDTDPTTKRLVTGVVDPQQTFDEIVGVVGDVREMGLDAGVVPTFYQIGTGPIMTLLVETAVKPEQLVAPLQAIIHQRDPQVAISSAKTLQQYLDESLARRKFTLAILGIFAGLSAFLTAVGIYGVFSRSVNARGREFGIRMAVGATQTNIRRMVLRETTIVAIPGIAAGVMLYVMFSRLMKGLIYRVSPTDPASLIGAGAAVCVLVLLSAWVPAKRASVVDPGECLRVE